MKIPSKIRYEKKRSGSGIRRVFVNMFINIER